MTTDPRKHPEPWYGDDEPRAAPLPVSGATRAEREAELLAGLAKRSYDEQAKRIERRLENLKDEDEQEFMETEDDRMTRDDLVAMFRKIAAVSPKRAAMWADEIMERGVRG